MALGGNLLKNDPKKEETAAASQAVDDTLDPTNNESIDQSKLVQYCVFKAGDEEYAIPIDLIKEVVKYSQPAPLPQVPNYILGMSNIRGNIYGILDIELYFHVRTSPVEHKYLLVLDHDTYKMAIGIEDVPDSLIINEDMLEELKTSAFKSTISQKYLKGVIKKDKRMIIVFDIMGIVSAESFAITS